MKISFLCSDENHPVNEYLREWILNYQETYKIELVRKVEDLSGGDLLFLISCSEIVSNQIRSNYTNSLVIHASDLPEGRGWSPHIWQLIEGKENIVLSLIEAEDTVDTGQVWQKLKIKIPKHFLWNEINEMVFMAEIELVDFAVNNFSKIESFPQDTVNNPKYYSKRTPEDSRIDPEKSIVSQFDLIRVCDPLRYPTFFEHLGCRYKLILEKYDDE